jgi:hypothetical protein
VHDDLLPLERRVEVRHHAHRPLRGAADPKRLGWSAILAPFAKRAIVEFRLGWLLDQICRGARAAAPVRRDDDEST